MPKRSGGLRIMAKRSCEFKTEVSQLLNLMIHSLYSNRDIFLRELIANAADAIDKARFDSLTDPAQARDWKISIGIDKEAKVLTITDNGIGMTEQEVIDNVGTIAKSGTRAFLKMLEEKGTSAADMPEMIGQFGVGFYSAFMVASKVELRTKRSGSDAPAVCWSSTGEGSFEIESCDRTEPGTEIKVFLKDDAEMYLESWKLTGIIHKYSDYIEYPITVPEVKVDEDKKETVTEKTVNSQKAIWLRKPSEITEDEYKSFYTHISNFAGTNYLKPIHISAEGVSEFKALLFLPKEAPFNLLMPDIQKKGLQLYVKRVFITDECKALLPDYLRFVSGVVDSGDLPLNVSREILQDNPHIAKIEKTITSKILGELKKLIENDRENYDLFFTEFGKILKEGLHTDFTNAEKLKDLVLYGSMNTPEDKKITLAEYVSAMPENQPAIYYITGDKRESVESNPGLEYFRKQGYDVLFMTDPIDEWVMQSMNQYAKKNFVSIIKDGLEIDGAEETVKAAAEKYGKILEYLKKEFEGKVSEVRFSVRLTESPCCLITEGSALAPHMERLFRAMNQAVPESKRILELNPEHPLIAALNDMAGDAENPDLKKYANVLWDQALLSEGSPIKDTAAFVKNVTELMLKGIGK